VQPALRLLLRVRGARRPHAYAARGLGLLLESVADEYRRRGWTFTLNFVLHGGEPLLLPGSYLRSFVELQREHLDGIPY
jgi:hypothetical protein